MNNWKSISLWTEVFVDETGKIVGQVDEISDVYHATVGTNCIGKYVSRSDAEKAVEKELGGT